MIFQDQVGNLIDLKSYPKRIISLVPSITELLFSLGLGDRIVGRTKFCIYPSEQIQGVKVVGGTKNFRFDDIHDLKPDLIIGNIEENYIEGIEELRKHFPVWMSDVITLDDNYDMISKLGEVTQSQESAKIIIDQTRRILSEIEGQFKGRVLYFIWKNPFMVVGKNTFIDNMLKFLGFENIVLQSRYPEIDEYVLKNYTPDYLFLSTEPYPFKKNGVPEVEKLIPNAKPVIVNGEFFSWYGSRLLSAGKYFQNLYEQL